MSSSIMRTAVAVLAASAVVTVSARAALAAPACTGTSIAVADPMASIFANGTGLVVPTFGYAGSVSSANQNVASFDLSTFGSGTSVALCGVGALNYGGGSPALRPMTGLTNAPGDAPGYFAAFLSSAPIGSSYAAFVAGAIARPGSVGSPDWVYGGSLASSYFLVQNGATGFVLPNGASSLIVSAADDYYGDNAIGAAPFEVRLEASAPVTSTPEPATFALVGGGLALAVIVRRRRS